MRASMEVCIDVQRRAKTTHCFPNRGFICFECITHLVCPLALSFTQSLHIVFLYRKLREKREEKEGVVQLLNLLMRKNI